MLRSGERLVFIKDIFFISLAARVILHGGGAAPPLKYEESVSARKFSAFSIDSVFNKPQVSFGGGRHCLSLSVVEVATAAGPCLRLFEEDNEYHTEILLAAASSPECRLIYQLLAIKESDKRYLDVIYSQHNNNNNQRFNVTKNN